MVLLDVAIATRDTRLRYLSVKLLTELGLRFLICAPGDSRCHASRCVISKEGELSAPDMYGNRLVLVGDNFDPDLVTISVMARLHGISDPTLTAVGVDPGMRYGLALTLDGCVVFSKVLLTPLSSAHRSLSWLQIVNKLYPQTRGVIRVGTGSRLYLVLYLRAIQQLDNNSEVELVDEHHTTFVGELDSSSAVLIAARRGRKFSSEDLELKPKAGYIRSIKRYMFKFTDGMVKLSSDEALAIVLGYSSVQDYLDALSAAEE